MLGPPLLCDLPPCRSTFTAPHDTSTAAVIGVARRARLTLMSTGYGDTFPDVRSFDRELSHRTLVQQGSPGVCAVGGTEAVICSCVQYFSRLQAHIVACRWGASASAVAVIYQKDRLEVCLQSALANAHLRRCLAQRRLLCIRCILYINATPSRSRRQGISPLSHTCCFAIYIFFSSGITRRV